MYYLQTTQAHNHSSFSLNLTFRSLVHLGSPSHWPVVFCGWLWLVWWNMGAANCDFPSLFHPPEWVMLTKSLGNGQAPPGKGGRSDPLSQALAAAGIFQDICKDVFAVSVLFTTSSHGVGDKENLVHSKLVSCPIFFDICSWPHLLVDKNL